MSSTKPVSTGFDINISVETGFGHQCIDLSEQTSKNWIWIVLNWLELDLGSNKAVGTGFG